MRETVTNYQDFAVVVSRIRGIQERLDSEVTVLWTRYGNDMVTDLAVIGRALDRVEVALSEAAGV